MENKKHYESFDGQLSQFIRWKDNCTAIFLEKKTGKEFELQGNHSKENLIFKIRAALKDMKSKTTLRIGLKKLLKKHGAKVSSQTSNSELVAILYGLFGCSDKKPSVDHSTAATTPIQKKRKKQLDLQNLSDVQRANILQCSAKIYVNEKCNGDVTKATPQLVMLNDVLKWRKAEFRGEAKKVFRWVNA